MQYVSQDENTKKKSFIKYQIVVGKKGIYVESEPNQFDFNV